MSPPHCAAPVCCKRRAIQASIGRDAGTERSTTGEVREQGAVDLEATKGLESAQEREDVAELAGEAIPRKTLTVARSMLPWVLQLAGAAALTDKADERRELAETVGTVDGGKDGYG